LDRFERTSWEAERKLFFQNKKKNSTKRDPFHPPPDEQEAAAAHAQGFRTMVDQKRYCHVNVDQLFRDEQWKAFFQQLQ